MSLVSRVEREGRSELIEKKKFEGRFSWCASCGPGFKRAPFLETAVCGFLYVAEYRVAGKLHLFKWILTLRLSY